MSEVTADVVIIGSGPGGATAAEVLTRAGWSVVIMEKGRNHLLDPDDPTQARRRLLERRDQVHLPLLPRARPADRAARLPVQRRTRASTRHVGEVNSIPTTVGGGGTHADGKVPRFREEDFRLSSTYGPQEHAAVEDWPLDYDELEPYYAEVERAIGVAGRAGANPFAAWRSGPYPMPPGAPMYGALLSSAAAEKVGLHPYEAPTAANSIAYDGRPACNNCGFCAFFGCPIHAKGDPVALLTKAMATGRAELMAETYVSRIVIEGQPGHRCRVHRRRTACRTPWTPTSSSWRAGRSRRHASSCSRGSSTLHWARHLMVPLPDDRGRALPRPCGCTRTRAVRHPRARRRHGAGRPLARGRGWGRASRGSAVAWSSTAEAACRSWRRATRPGGATHAQAMRESNLRERMWAFIMQGEDLPVRDQHGRPEPLHPRRPRLPGGPGHLPARAPRAGRVEVPRQDPAVRAGGDGRRVGAAHLVARASRTTASARRPFPRAATSSARPAWGTTPTPRWSTAGAGCTRSTTSSSPTPRSSSPRAATGPRSRWSPWRPGRRTTWPGRPADRPVDRLIAQGAAARYLASGSRPSAHARGSAAWCRRSGRRRWPPRPPRGPAAGPHDLARRRPRRAAARRPRG